jgi:hypothetical protein
MEKNVKQYANYLIDMYQDIGGTKNSSIYRRLTDKGLDIFKVTELACEIEIIYQREEKLNTLLNEKRKRTIR